MKAYINSPDGSINIKKDIKSKNKNSTGINCLLSTETDMLVVVLGGHMTSNMAAPMSDCASRCLCF